MTSGHQPKKGQGTPTSPPNEGSGGKKGDSPVSLSGEPQSCETCRFFGYQAKLRNTGAGFTEELEGCCRRRSPVFAQGDGSTYFPETLIGNWCGEYKPNYGRINEASVAIRCMADGHIFIDDRCVRCGKWTSEVLPIPAQEDSLFCPKSPDGGHCYSGGSVSIGCSLCGHIP